LTLHLLFSHTLTPQQEKDAKESLGVSRIVPLREDLRQRFANVPPELESLDEYVRPFVEYLLEVGEPGDFVLIQGEFGLVYRLVEVAKAMGLVPIYATTKRVVKEEQENGRVIKRSVFEHVRFRRY